MEIFEILRAGILQDTTYRPYYCLCIIEADKFLVTRKRSLLFEKKIQASASHNNLFTSLKEKNAGSTVFFAQPVRTNHLKANNKKQVNVSNFRS